MSRPLLSVIVVNYNTCEATSACLASVREQEVDFDVEVVLVDNGSADSSAEILRRRHPEVHVIEAGENLGFARGVNLGVHHATGEYVLLLNPDTLVRPGTLAQLVSFARRHPDYGVYGGRTLRPDGSVDPSSCWGAPTLWSLTSFALGLSTAFKGSRVFDPEALGGWERDSVREVPIVTGCLLLTSRTDWDRIGGMDELFFLYGEDAEFSLRARAKGYRPVVVPEAVIVHEVGGSTASAGRKMSMVMAGKVTLLERAWPAPRARVGIALLLLGSLVRTGLEVASRRRTPTWGVVWRQRDDWRHGYPEAEQRIFGRPVPTAP